MAEKTIKIADKPTLDEIKSLLSDDKHGLNSLKDTIEPDAIKQRLSVILLDSIFNSSWTLVSNTPYDINQTPIVVYNDEIHILGSYCHSNNWSSHYKWNGSEWIADVNVPAGMNGAFAVVCNNEMHAIGGYSNQRVHYKWNGSEWTSVSTLPINTYGASVTVYNNEIHILGGTSHYKWNGSEWTSVSTLPYSHGRSAVVYNNEIHILYGTNHYKWNGSEWTSVSTLPFRFTDGCAVVYNNEIHILYGTNHYKWNGSEWEQISVLPHTFAYGCAVVYNNDLCILGKNNTGKTHYKLLDLRVFPNVYLPKDTKIYSHHNLGSISNCTFDTDHLVVTDDGMVSFGAKTSDTWSIITIIN